MDQSDAPEVDAPDSRSVAERVQTGLVEAGTADTFTPRGSVELIAPAPTAVPEAQRAAVAEVAELAGRLAHEIRNPLSTMRMNLDLLAEDFENPENQRERRALVKIERVRKESHRLQAILEDFLRFVRIKDLRTRPTNLNDLVDDLRDFCEGEGLAHAIVSRAALDPELPPVALDAELFKQALFNLIRNAQLAMPDGGELILTTRRAGDWAVLDVIDTGVGIPPEDRDRIFEPFVSSRPGGSGLGLPTTRRIVEAHGGRLSVESEPGRGSKFTVRLPLASLI